MGSLILLALIGSWILYTYRYRGTVEQISFLSGEVRMSGLFIKPSDPGPYSVVVLLHGAGPLPADGPPVRVIANALLRNGIGVLTYDKRGVGSSVLPSSTVNLGKVVRSIHCALRN